MKRSTTVFLIMMMVVTTSLFSQNEKTNRALLIIDIQDFYFPGGIKPLVEPVKAGEKAAVLLDHFRKNNELVVHIRHNSPAGADINQIVKPLDGEKIISKVEVNAFKGTDLKEFLDAHGVGTLIICGMQTHMCVEGATRAASDLDYKCTLIHDACTTRDLNFQDKTIKAEDVHYATLVTLKNYAKVISLNEFLELEAKGN